MVAAAAYSYTLYVIHFPLTLLAYGIDESPWFAVIAGIAILGFAALVGPRIESISILSRRRPSPVVTS